MADGEEKKNGPEPEAPQTDAIQIEAEARQAEPEAPKTASPSAPSEELAQHEESAPAASASSAGPVADGTASTREPELVIAAKVGGATISEAKTSAAEVRAAYEHPLAIRVTHWINAVCVFVLVTSGLRIFRAFPSFGPKIPEQDLIDIPKAITLGGWLGGALQWHFTFMWLFAASGAVYLSYQLLSGHYRTVLFTPKDIPGVWPMVRHYFLFGPKPPVTGQYNPLQKLAYTSTVGFGILSFLTGLVLYKPDQFSWLAFLFGGFHLTRIWHFVSMCGFVAFVPGHLIMVALHGWSNFYSMLAGWKREPEYQD
ncbi:MAG: cytochrome b/b6 domain-containing protein [Terriglobales bacterium]